jgi:hypothetical protein
MRNVKNLTILNLLVTITQKLTSMKDLEHVMLKQKMQMWKLVFVKQSWIMQTGLLNARSLIAKRKFIVNMSNYSRIAMSLKILMRRNNA